MRHLFCHLNDARALRANPLVSRFFEAPNGRLTKAQQRDGTAQIRRLISEEAARCREIDIAAGQKERAYRQFAIIRGCYVERKRPEEIATELGISVRQFYRERASICRRIAATIRIYDVTPHAYVETAGLTEWQFMMARAASQAEAGEYNLALRTYEEIACAVRPAQHTIEALCKSAELLLELGDVVAARGVLSNAVMVLRNTAPLPSIVDHAARLHITLLESSVAWSGGAFAAEAAMTARVMEMIERFPPGGGKRVKELWVKALTEAANRATFRGQFQKAFSILTIADRAFQSAATASLGHEFDLKIAHATLAMVSDRQNAAAVMEQQFAALNEAREIARRCGSLRQVIQAEFNLAQRDAYAGNIADYLRKARLIMAMAERLGNNRLKALTVLHFTDYLVVTNAPSKLVLQLLYDSASNLVDRGPEWATMMHQKGMCYLRAGKAQSALDCEQQARSVAAAMGNQRLLAATLRGMATAAYYLGREREAAEYVIAALPMVEEYGSPMSCLQTYRAAALIIGSAKYSQAAVALNRTMGLPNTTF